MRYFLRLSSLLFSNMKVSNSPNACVSATRPPSTFLLLHVFIVTTEWRVAHNRTHKKKTANTAQFNELYQPRLEYVLDTRILDSVTTT